MDYANIRKSIADLSKSISQKRRKKTNLEKDLQELHEDKKKAESNFFAAKAKRELHDKKKYTEELLKPLEGKRTKLIEELKQLEMEYNEALETLTVDNLMKDSSSRQEILEEVKSTADKLHDLIVSIVGERFYCELEKQLSVPTVIEDTEKLEDVIDYFNICERQIEKISKHSGKITKIVDKLQAIIMSVNFDDKVADTKLDIVVAVLVLVLLLIGFKYVFPVYMCLLVLALAFNLMRHYSLFKIMLIQKTVRDNVDGIEAVILQQILDTIEQRKEEIKEKYEQSVACINNELNEVDKEVTRVAGTVDSTFKFDDSGVLKSYTLATERKEMRERKIVEDIATIEEEIAKEQELMNQKKELLNSALCKIQAQYLDATKIGDSYEFEPKFLQNVDKDKLEFWTHPKDSCFFVYQNEEDIYEFTKLILLQLRVRLNPFAYVVDVYDPVLVGRDFLRFQPDNPKKLISIESLFRIFTDESKFVEAFSEYREDLNIRRTEIYKEYSNIAEYNKFMLSIESLTLTYRFLFLLSPSATIMQNKALLQIAQNGGDLGIYVHYFVSEDDCVKIGERISDILSSVSRIYTIDRSGAKPKAKDWLLDFIKIKKEEAKSKN